MGLFTGLAIGALATTVVAQAATRKKGSQPTGQPLAPGPVEPLAPPTPPALDPAANQQTAQLAASRQRKRAAGSLIGTGRPPASGTTPPTKTRPKTLIGAY